MLPFDTDAPLYHRPWVTAGLVCACCLVHFWVTFFDPDAVSQWALVYGSGLHPLQWVTRNFLHADFMHLVGNMAFLWSFGLVVEGKVGGFRMLGLCTALGIGQASLEQSCSFWFVGGTSVGISAVVSGLMAMALIWAPANHLRCIAPWNLFGTHWLLEPWEIPIWGVAGLYLGLDAAMVVWNGFHVSTSLLHFLGGLLGLALATYLLMRKKVDCEGWDLFTLWRRRELLAENAARRAAGIPPVPLEPAFAPSTTSLERKLIEIDRALFRNRVDRAWRILQLTRRVVPTWELPEETLLLMAEQLARQGQHANAAELFEEYLRRFERHADPVRLQLAQILIEHLNRPRYALRLLRQSPVESNGASVSIRLREQLEREAQRQIDLGVFELDGNGGRAR
ncbi:MAG: rhomboid family intramembrane serine protease [Planctomycetota bacterium]|nr:rhomboid family intramembrane serine protease [Planctomycetota bacterium]